MKISSAPLGNNKDFAPQEINSLEDFVKIATTRHYSTGIFDNNHRTTKNFLQAQSIGIDVDDGMTIDEAQVRFGDYKHLIMPSKSHRKEKNGVVCDRFRVILFLEDTITSPQDFKATWYALQKLCPEMDKQCKDPSRFYYPSTEVVSRRDEGKLWPVTKYIAPEPTDLDLALADTDAPKGKLAMNTLRFLQDGARAGEAHGVLVKACIDLKEQGYTADQAKFKVEAMIKSGGTWATDYLNDKDVLTIDDIYGREVKYPARENEVTRKSMFNFQNILQLIQEAGEINWLVEGLLTKGGFSLMVGPPKAGKSTLVRQLIKSIAQGLPFLDRPIKQGKVLYLTFEEQPAVLKTQFAAVGISPNDPIMIHAGIVFGETMLEDLKDAIIEHVPELVVLDTLFKISQLESINSYKEVQDALAHITKLARDTDTHILGVHHTNKGGAGNNSIMGSNAILGALDTLIRFHPEQDRRYLFSTGKHGDHFDDQEILFNPKNETYTLGKAKDKNYGESL